MKTIPKTFLQKTAKIVQANIAKKELLLLISTEFQLSASQIYRKIKQQTNLSPSVYIRQKRLEQAHIWIKQSDLPIAEIAKSVGFQQLAYFSRCFSNYYGYSPITLRRKETSNKNAI